MKTYEFANALSQMAKILKSMPNQEMDNLSFQSLDKIGSGNKKEKAVVGLHTLATLSKIDKSQWLDLIEEHDFNIPIRPRDANRDIIGKLLSYIDKNESAQESIKKSAEKSGGMPSSELSKALSLLMGG